MEFTRLNLNWTDVWLLYKQLRKDISNSRFYQACDLDLNALKIFAFCCYTASA